MKTKICSSFWSDPDIENATPEIRLTALWLESNERVSLFGYAEISERRFEFETGCPRQALANTFKALPKRYVVTAQGYWVRHYIREQFGEGEALRRNNLFRSISRALAGCSSAEVQALVVAEYPIFHVIQPITSPSTAKPLASPTQVESVSVSVRESVSVSASVGVGEAGPVATPAPAKSRRATTPAAPASVLPAEQPAEIRRRMLLVNECKRRGEGTRWTAKEFAAFRSAGLDTCDESTFEEQVAPVRDYYTAPLEQLRPYWNTKGDEDYRRRDLATLLNNWPGEVDKAQDWCAFEAKRIAERGSGRL